MARHRFVVVGTVSEGPGRHFGLCLRPAPRGAGRRGRPVLHVAVPDPGGLVAGPPLQPVGRPQRPLASPHGQDPGRPQRRPGRGCARGPGSCWRARTAVSPGTAGGGRKVLLIGAGVGITPLRALFESLHGPRERLAFIYRASAPADLALRRELDEIARPPQGQRPLPGRLERRAPRVPGAGPSTAAGARRRQRDVYVCGPPGSRKWSALRCGPWASRGARSIPNRSSCRRDGTGMRRAIIATAGTVVGPGRPAGYKSSGPQRCKGCR